VSSGEAYRLIKAKVRAYCAAPDADAVALLYDLNGIIDKVATESGRTLQEINRSGSKTLIGRIASALRRDRARTNRQDS
jgi:hypothetical protein